MPTKYPEEIKRKVVALANNGKNQTVDNFLQAIENEDIDAAKSYAYEAEFQHVSAETGDILTLDTYMNIYELALFNGAYFNRVVLPDKINELILNNKVRVTGVLEVSGVDINGNPYSDSYPVELRVENINGEWLITYMKD